MRVVAGVSGFARNAAVAVARDGVLAAVCEEGRVTRVRDVGIAAGGFPRGALKLALAAADLPADAPLDLVVGEAALADVCREATVVDHHFAHAATAFFTSPHDDALILVCDSQPLREISLWRGKGAAIERVAFDWKGAAFAGLYSRLTAAMGLVPGRDEYRVEALARLGSGADAGAVGSMLGYSAGRIEVSADFDGYVSAACADGNLTESAAVAGTVQRRIGQLLLECLRDIRAAHDARTLCVGGGLFFNTSFNTIVRDSGLFDEVFVPINPGNPGVAAGCALARSCELAGRRATLEPSSPFLGPSYTNQEIKAVLDNCKLSYEFLEDSHIVAAAVRALMNGELVGWFRGRLEWGTRALGNRSIFANPQAPYVLENLNTFLKQREAFRAYGLAVPRDQGPELFEGLSASPFMECEYRLRDPKAFAHICPPGIETVRVQTVDAEPPLVRDLLKAFGTASGLPVLVNTSFNGFHEPIVCSPRDAVRVFYGSGLDLLVVGNFVLRK
jgi:carbamoyltransferase